jgi:hypothetical protein
MSSAAWRSSSEIGFSGADMGEDQQVWKMMSMQCGSILLMARFVRDFDSGTVIDP